MRSRRRRRQPTSIVLDDEIKAGLKAIAESQGRSRADLISWVLFCYFRDNKPRKKLQPKPVEPQQLRSDW